MSITVRIPTPLRSATGGESEVPVDAATVREMLEALEQKYPGIRQRLCEENGEVRRFVNVFVGDEDIRFLQGLQTPIPDGTSVSIIPAVAGGR
ncbi:MAG TPA: ubiquitin-like small modifier protein 1 [Actinomycetota bacterium]|nr:ubiquitin-like small modifier protein 1 [Actinomycetota bacterium]